MMFRPTLLAIAALALGLPLAAQAQATGRLKVGLMLPATGTFAALGTAIENGFRLQVQDYAKAYKQRPDVYAVQGYDAAQMLAIGLAATKGDTSKKAEIAAAIERTKVDSPRGAFLVGKNHNPVQDIYLRQVKGKENVLVGVASKQLADPGRGCKL